MSERVAFIGLGVMGYPMAGHLRKAGYDVTVFNRTTSKAERWVSEFGGRSAGTPVEAAEGATFVFSCVGADDDVRAIATGPDGALHGMADSSVFIDHTTASAKLARELADEANARRCSFLDAPVSGGQSGAEEGRLTVMVGGDAAAFERARPLIECYAKQVKRLGSAGSGQVAKMVNQICIAGLLQGLAEGLRFAENAGLDAEAVVEVISKGAAQSWQMENRYRTMVDGIFDYGFAVDWMRKDLKIALDEARANGSSLPVTALVDQFYVDIQAVGGGRWDTSSLIERLRRSR